MQRVIVLAILLGCLVASQLSAQNLSEHFRGELYPHVAYGVVKDHPLLSTTEPLKSLSWQVKTWFEAQVPLHVFTSTTTGGLLAPLSTVECLGIPGGYSCQAPMPPTILAAWPSITGIEIQQVDQAGAVVQRSAALAVQATPLAACSWSAPESTVVETRPVDTAIGGYMTNDMMAAALRIGQLRRDGWRVEWQFSNAVYGTMGGQLSPDRLVVLYWCFGTPQ